MPDGAHSLTQTVQAGGCVEEPTFVGFYPPEFTAVSVHVGLHAASFHWFLFHATEGENC